MRLCLRHFSFGMFLVAGSLFGQSPEPNSGAETPAGSPPPPQPVRRRVIVATPAEPGTAALEWQVQQNTQKLQELMQKLDQLTASLKADLAQNAQDLKEIKGELAKRSGPAASGTSAAAPAEAATSPVPVASAIPATAGLPAASGTRHTVQKGETLTSIAKQHGVTIDEISKANSIQDARKLQVGQELIIPSPAQPEPKAQ